MAKQLTPKKHLISVTNVKGLSRILLCTLAALGMFLNVRPPSAQALSGKSWKAGRIIDDAVFVNKDSMTVAQIQEFLNAKNPICDTKGEQSVTYKYPFGSDTYVTTTRAVYADRKGNPKPTGVQIFTCLKEYYEVQKTDPSTTPVKSNYGGVAIPPGAVSAAQIIWDAARAYSISPKVLLTTLQKEQSLITDEWPLNNQFLYAMGARCPDTPSGPNCDNTYSGFSIQIRESARLLRLYLDNMYQSWWTYNPNDPDSYKRPGINQIYWNVKYTGCGYGQVQIENASTVALYTYTPYQPNEAALNNLYGEGDGCSAYGNRNFWRMFNDWFGPTIGPLIRTLDSPTLFYSDGEYRYRITSMDIAREYGLGLSDVRIVSQAELDSLPIASAPNSSTLSIIVKSNSDTDTDGGNIYLISNGLRYRFATMTQFYEFGFTLDKIGYMPLVQLERMPLASNALSNFLQNSLTSFAYRVSSGKKNGIFELTTYNSLNPGGKISPLSPFVLGLIPTGEPIINGQAVMREPGGKIWYRTNWGWYHVLSMQVFDCWGLGAAKSFTFTPEQAATGTLQGGLKCGAKTETNKLYLMDGTKKITLDPSWGITNTSAVTDELVSGFQTVSTSLKTSFKTSKSTSLFALSDGKKRPIINMSSFIANGFDEKSILSITTSALDTIPNGTKLLYSGLLAKDGTNNLYAINGASKLYIPSMSAFEAFGFSPQSVISLNSDDLNSYPTSGLPLYVIVKTAATNVLVDASKSYTIPSALLTAYGISASTPIYEAGLLAGTTDAGQMGRFIKSSSSPTLYYMDAGKRRPVSSWASFISLGGTAGGYTTLTEGTINSIPRGTTI